MLLTLTSALLLACVTLASAEKSYRGHSVVLVEAKTDEQLNVLKQLEGESDGVIFLKNPSIVTPSVMLTSPEKMASVESALQGVGLNISVLTSDYQQIIDQANAENKENRLRSNGTSRVNGRLLYNHGFYRDMDEINEMMVELVTEYPLLVRRIEAPFRTEYYGDQVYYLEVGSPGSSKPVIMIESTAHAREWIVVSSLLYVIDSMLQGYVNGNQDAVDALTEFTWVIIPVVNPDGYRYSISNNRIWRKNLKQFGNCLGVDLNRNFDYDFGGVGTSNNCGSDIYPGTSAFSESEAANVRDIFYKYQSRAQSYLSIHSYSELLLHPWGNKQTYNDPNPPQNIDLLLSVGQKMRQAIYANGGRDYRLGTAYGVLGYAAAGTSEDWALSVKPDLLAYCYELRPRSQSAGGFVLNPNQIVPTGVEFLASLYALSNELIALK